MKVKVIQCFPIFELEEFLQEWMDLNPDIEIQSISQSDAGNDNVNVIILYTNSSQ